MHLRQENTLHWLSINWACYNDNSEMNASSVPESLRVEKRTNHGERS